ncbi:MAG: 5-deoxy-glucuronate isomerase [Hyphomicrobiales bacterium]|nr:5-deoxy-glucuronate isomerase [Hyphomicrobiales bacterium]
MPAFSKWSDTNLAEVEVRPENQDWKYVGFKVAAMAPGEVVSGHSDAAETCLVLIHGRAGFTVDGQPLGEPGERTSPFMGLPHAVYVPPGRRWRVGATTVADLAICTAPGEVDRYPVRVIRPDELTTETRGEGTNTRYVTDILAEGDEAAHSLFVIELITPDGHTSSYPPHKHDRDDLPEESLLEETYYSRFSPPQGFGFQRIYNDDRSLDETLLLQNGTLTRVSEGYHPCTVCHGYDMYQLCVMAGPKRLWRFRTDPDHDWLAHGNLKISEIDSRRSSK